MRSQVKSLLAASGAFDRAPAAGATILTYHRVGGGTSDELDIPMDALEEQLDHLVDGGHEVRSLDEALDRLEAGDPTSTVVLTFDDGFADVHERAWPLLRERSLPFTVYVTAGLLGASMRWEGSTASSQGAPSLSWDQLGEMHAAGLCTVGNHTWDHATPAELDEAQLDRCSDAIEGHLGSRPAHFAWTWGVPVARLRPAVETRFRSVATGELGRNLPGGDLHALRRVPVRSTDPLAFFRAKLKGRLVAERAYAGLVTIAKRAGRRSAG